MADPVEPSVPPPSSPPPDPTMHSTSTTGLPSNVAAALATVPLIGGIIFYVLEKQDSFVRFYAMQSIIFGGAWVLLEIVYRIAHGTLMQIPWIGPVFAFVVLMAWVLVSIGL